MSDIISLKNVVFMTHDDWRAVNGISCCIRENERVTVCGGSNSGKDTLMRLIAGMDMPNSGSVFVLGQAVHELGNDKAAVFTNRHIGIMQRESGFIEAMSVAENISLPLMVQGIKRDRRMKEADNLLKMLGIQHVAQARPALLSTYETRTACIARALITKPRLLLLNEVTSRLSERDSDKIIETMNVAASYGDFTTLWFSDSDNKFDTNRTIQLDNGKIREDIK